MFTCFNRRCIWLVLISMLLALSVNSDASPNLPGAHSQLACDACHTGTPVSGQTVDDVELVRYPEDALCLECHTQEDVAAKTSTNDGDWNAMHDANLLCGTCHAISKSEMIDGSHLIRVGMGLDEFQMCRTCHSQDVDSVDVLDWGYDSEWPEDSNIRVYVRSLVVDSAENVIQLNSTVFSSGDPTGCFPEHGGCSLKWSCQGSAPGFGIELAYQNLDNQYINGEIVYEGLTSLKYADLDWDITNIPPGTYDVTLTPFYCSTLGVPFVFTVVVPSSAQILVTPSSIDYGWTQINTLSREAKITIANVGDVNLSIGDIITTGEYVSQFQIANDECSSSSLQPGNSCALRVIHQPSSIGNHRAEILIPSSDVNFSQKEVILEAEGVNIPDIEASSHALHFSTYAGQNQSEVKSVAIQNTGQGPLVINQLWIENAEYFSANMGTCAGQTIWPSQQCSLEVSFSPSTPGDWNDSTLYVGCNDPTLPLRQIPSTDPPENANALAISLYGTAFTPTLYLQVQTTGSGTGTVTISPSGVECGGVCGDYFDMMTEVSLTAEPGVGSTFGGWSCQNPSDGQACSCKEDALCSFVLTKDTYLVAYFYDMNSPDSDEDGLLNLQEDMNGNGVVDAGETDPFNPDTDGDGLLDGEEGFLRFGWIWIPWTDPRNPDTDGDGVTDGVEVGVFGVDADPTTTTNPMVTDTDGDGLSDGEEDANGNGAVDGGEADPTNPDTDGDGISDGDESAGGRSPVVNEAALISIISILLLN